MGRLIRLSDGRVFPLVSRTLVGRSKDALVVLDEPYASSEHARIVWTEGLWRIRDLGSKNGTFVDGTQLRAGEPMTLSPGSSLGFGQPNGWRLEDDAGPGPAAMNLDRGEVHSGGAEILALPSDEHPAVSVYRGEHDQWLLERPEREAVRISDGEIVTAGAHRYRLILPIANPGTPTVESSFSLPSVTFAFEHPRSEDHVDLVLRRGRDELRLERREHNYLLLNLARARAEDADRPEAERGWRSNEQLARLLGVDLALVNIHVHRARRQLEAAGLEGAAQVVETRKGLKRLGTARFSIAVLD